MFLLEILLVNTQKNIDSKCSMVPILEFSLCLLTLKRNLCKNYNISEGRYYTYEYIIFMQPIFSLIFRFRIQGVTTQSINRLFFCHVFGHSRQVNNQLTSDVNLHVYIIHTFILGRFLKSGKGSFEQICGISIWSPHCKNT